MDKNEKLKLLTKSRYVNGLKCSKWIWLAFNKPEALPEVDEATQHRFDEGNKVGELAKTLFPKGAKISFPLLFSRSLREISKTCNSEICLFTTSSLSSISFDC